MAALDLKIKVYWNKGYDFIISVHDVTNNILSRDSSYIVDLVMRAKFGNSTSMDKIFEKNSSLYVK